MSCLSNFLKDECQTFLDNFLNLMFLFLHVRRFNAFGLCTVKRRPPPDFGKFWWEFFMIFTYKMINRIEKIGTWSPAWAFFLLLWLCFSTHMHESIYLKVPCYAHFRFTLLQTSYRCVLFTSSNIRKENMSSLAVAPLSTLSETLPFNASLCKAPLPKSVSYQSFSFNDWIIIISYTS